MERGAAVGVDGSPAAREHAKALWTDVDNLNEGVVETLSRVRDVTGAQPREQLAGQNPDRWPEPDNADVPIVVELVRNADDQWRVCVDGILSRAVPTPFVAADATLTTDCDKSEIPQQCREEDVFDDLSVLVMEECRIPPPVPANAASTSSPRDIMFTCRVEEGAMHPSHVRVLAHQVLHCDVRARSAVDDPGVHIAADEEQLMSAHSLSPYTPRDATAPALALPYPLATAPPSTIGVVSNREAQRYTEQKTLAAKLLDEKNKTAEEARARREKRWERENDRLEARNRQYRRRKSSILRAAGLSVKNWYAYTKRAIEREQMRQNYEADLRRRRAEIMARGDRMPPRMQPNVYRFGGPGLSAPRSVAEMLQEANDAMDRVIDYCVTVEKNVRPRSRFQQILGGASVSNDVVRRRLVMWRAEVGRVNDRALVLLDALLSFNTSVDFTKDQVESKQNQAVVEAPIEGGFETRKKEEKDFAYTFVFDQAAFASRRSTYLYVKYTIEITEFDGKVWRVPVVPEVSFAFAASAIQADVRGDEKEFTKQADRFVETLGKLSTAWDPKKIFKGRKPPWPLGNTFVDEESLEQWMKNEGSSNKDERSGFFEQPSGSFAFDYSQSDITKLLKNMTNGVAVLKRYLNKGTDQEWPTPAMLLSASPRANSGTVRELYRTMPQLPIPMRVEAIKVQRPTRTDVEWQLATLPASDMWRGGGGGRFLTHLGKAAIASLKPNVASLSAASQAASRTFWTFVSTQKPWLIAYNAVSSLTGGVSLMAPVTSSVIAAASFALYVISSSILEEVAKSSIASAASPLIPLLVSVGTFGVYLYNVVYLRQGVDAYAEHKRQYEDELKQLIVKNRLLARALADARREVFGEPVKLAAERARCVIQKRDQRLRRYRAFVSMENLSSFRNTVERLVLVQRYLCPATVAPLHDSFRSTLPLDVHWNNAPNSELIGLQIPVDILDCLYEAISLRRLHIRETMRIVVGRGAAPFAVDAVEVAAASAYRDIMSGIVSTRSVVQAKHIIESPASCAKRLVDAGEVHLAALCAGDADVLLPCGDDHLWSCLHGGMAIRLALRHLTCFSEADSERQRLQSIFDLRMKAHEDSKEVEEWRVATKEWEGLAEGAVERIRKFVFSDKNTGSDLVAQGTRLLADVDWEPIEKMSNKLQETYRRTLCSCTRREVASALRSYRRAMRTQSSAARRGVLLQFARALSAEAQRGVRAETRAPLPSPANAMETQLRAGAVASAKRLQQLRVDGALEIVATSLPFAARLQSTTDVVKELRGWIDAAFNADVCTWNDARVLNNALLQEALRAHWAACRIDVDAMVAVRKVASVNDVIAQLVKVSVSQRTEVHHYYCPMHHTLGTMLTNASNYGAFTPASAYLDILRSAITLVKQTLASDAEPFSCPATRISHAGAQTPPPTGFARHPYVLTLRLWENPRLQECDQEVVMHSSRLAYWLESQSTLTTAESAPVIVAIARTLYFNADRFKQALALAVHGVPTETLIVAQIDATTDEPEARALGRALDIRALALGIVFYTQETGWPAPPLAVRVVGAPTDINPLEPAVADLRAQLSTTLGVIDGALARGCKAAYANEVCLALASDLVRA